MKKYMRVLRNCPLFSEMTNGEIESILACLGERVVRAGKNQVILEEGDPAEYMGIVLQGGVRIVREDYYGNRSIVAEVEPAEMFAETVAAAGAKRMPVSAVASADSEIILLDCRKMLFSCEKNCSFHGRLTSNLLRVIAGKNMILNQKLEIISKRTTREKLMAYLLYEAKRKNSEEFEIPYNRQELADFLGVDRSAMSAEIARMRKDGIIDSEKSRFRLHGHSTDACI